MFVIPLAYSNNTDWYWQYVTEVQVVGTKNSTGNVLAPSHHKDIPEDEEWTSVSRSGEISSPPTVTLTPTPRSTKLSEKIAYVTITVHVLLQLFA